jgi:phospholipid transport system transporter-binding protein
MAATLAQQADGTVTLQGALTLEQARACHDDSLSWLKAGMPRRIDLSAVTAIDSSALALLLEWQRWAMDAATALEFNNPPQALQVLATLSHVHGLLGWAAVDFDRNAS